MDLEEIYEQGLKAFERIYGHLRNNPITPRGLAEKKVDVSKALRILTDMFASDPDLITPELKQVVGAVETYERHARESFNALRLNDFNSQLEGTNYFR